MVPRHICRGDQSRVFTHTEVNQLDGLGQNKEVLGFRRLHLRKLATEVFHKHIMKPSAQLHRLGANELEALISGS